MTMYTKNDSSALEVGYAPHLCAAPLSRRLVAVGTTGSAGTVDHYFANVSQNQWSQNYRIKSGTFPSRLPYGFLAFPVASEYNSPCLRSRTFGWFQPLRSWKSSMPCALFY